jgi:hypothetical protein
MPRKEFESFTRLDASDVNTYLMDQSVMTFAGTAARGSAITTPVEGMVTYLEDSNSLQLYDGSRWTSAGGVSSGNAIINGGFDIWQRGTSATLAVGLLVADRWKHDFVTAVQTGTASRQSFTSGELDSLGVTNNQFYQRIVSTDNNGSTQHVFFQNIEDVTTFANTTVTISFYAKAAASATLQTRIVQLFGSGGSSPVTTTFVDHSLTTSWQRFTVTVPVPSITGKTIGAGSSLRLDFSLPLTTYTIDIWGVQLEAGPTANVFRRNANSLQGELAACQRYYFRITGSARIASGISSGTTTHLGIIHFPVTMRVQPGSIDFSTVAVTNEVTYTNAASTVALFNTTLQTAQVQATATGQTTNQASNLVLQSSGFIGFSAEL